MVVQAVQYSRFGDEEVLDLVNIKSDSLKLNQVGRSSCSWFKSY